MDELYTVDILLFTQSQTEGIEGKAEEEEPVNNTNLSTEYRNSAVTKR